MIEIETPADMAQWAGRKLGTSEWFTVDQKTIDLFAEATGDQPFPLNSRVRHAAWDEGLVMRYEGDKIVVLFDGVGYKTLALPLVLESELLRPAG